MAEHIIRYATKSDFDGVMSIGDVYSGTDYLQHSYHRWMEETYSRSYIYLIGHQVVAFCSGIRIDDGQTLMVRGGRVRNDFRDQGIFGQLLKHVYKEHNQMQNVRTEVMTTHSDNYKARKEKFLKQFTENYAKIILGAFCDASDIEIPEIPAIHSTDVLTEEGLLSVFTTEGTREDLFPSGRLIVDWAPYKPLASNLKYIMLPGGLVLKTKDTDKLTQLLTISSHYPCEMGFKYIVDVFGNDVSHLQDHLILHIKNMKSLTDKKVLFVVTTFEKHEKDTEEILTKLKLQLSDCPRIFIHFLERKLPA